MTDTETHLKDLELIFQKEVFQILSILAKRRTEPTSFTTLKTSLSLNPNSLSRYLKRLERFGLVENYYEKQDFRAYSFYRLTERALDILNLQVGMPRIWEVVREFKSYCKSKGWEVAELEDWIKVDNQYHNLLWARTIPTTFRAVTKLHRMAKKEETSYRVVNVAYMAWLFVEAVPSELYQMMDEEGFIANTAIYDFSQAYLRQPIVTMLNETDSNVFREFEHFLQIRWNFKLTHADLLIRDPNRKQN